MIIKWLNKLGFVGQHAIELARKKPVQMIFAGEAKLGEILRPLFSSGKELTEAQLTNAIYEGMASIRKDVAGFYKDRYGRSYKNPAGSITDRNQAKAIAAQYKATLRAKLPDYETKKEALAAIEYKADVISATQAARATNEERDYILRRMSKTKKWQAELDGNTCRNCKSLNGKEISATKSFKPPPPKHPHCRCYVTYHDAKGKEII